MTLEEAIRELKSDRSLYESDIVFANDGTPDGDLIQAINMAIEALEKQIAKKPNLQGDGYADGELVYDYAECPVCGCDFEEDTTNWGCKFCPDCGQALDWRETE